MKNINMKNDGLCFAHFQQSCDCENNENAKNEKMTFSSLAEGGTPICTQCEEEYEFLGVEIVPQKPGKKSRLRVRHGSPSMPKKERPVGSYKFSSDEDRDEALKLLDDFNGFLDYEILYPKG